MYNAKRKEISPTLNVNKNNMGVLVECDIEQWKIQFLAITSEFMGKEKGWKYFKMICFNILTRIRASRQNHYEGDQEWFVRCTCYGGSEHSQIKRKRAKFGGKYIKGLLFAYLNC